MRTQETIAKIPVSIGSLSTFGLAGTYHYDKEIHDLFSRPLPEKNPETREEAWMVLVDWHLSKPEYQHFYHLFYIVEFITVRH